MPGVLSQGVALLLLNVCFLWWFIRQARRENPDPTARRLASFRRAADFHLSLIWLVWAYLAGLIFWLWVSGWPSLTSLVPPAGLGAALGILNTVVILGRSAFLLHAVGTLNFFCIFAFLPNLNAWLGLGYPRSEWAFEARITAILVAGVAFALVQLPARPWVRRLRENLGPDPTSATPAHLVIPKGVEP